MQDSQDTFGPLASVVGEAPVLEEELKLKLLQGDDAGAAQLIRRAAEQLRPSPEWLDLIATHDLPLALEAYLAATAGPHPSWRDRMRAWGHAVNSGSWGVIKRMIELDVPGGSRLPRGMPLEVARAIMVNPQLRRGGLGVEALDRGVFDHNWPATRLVLENIDVKSALRDYGISETVHRILLVAPLDIVALALERGLAAPGQVIQGAVKQVAAGRAAALLGLLKGLGHNLDAYFSLGMGGSPQVNQVLYNPDYAETALLRLLGCYAAAASWVDLFRRMGAQLVRPDLFLRK